MIARSEVNKNKAQTEVYHEQASIQAKDLAHYEERFDREVLNSKIENITKCLKVIVDGVDVASHFIGAGAIQRLVRLKGDQLELDKIDKGYDLGKKLIEDNGKYQKQALDAEKARLQKELDDARELNAKRNKGVKQTNVNP